jgi:hypothetical protein
LPRGAPVRRVAEPLTAALAFLTDAPLLAPLPAPPRFGDAAGFAFWAMIPVSFQERLQERHCKKRIEASCKRKDRGVQKITGRHWTVSARSLDAVNRV